MRYMKSALIATLVVSTGLVWSATGASGQGDAAKKPAVIGDWTGTWGDYSAPGPAAKDSKYSGRQAQLDCKVEALADGKFRATFSGECGRPYKYVIQVPGRGVGNVVLFQGSADLGAKDGGVYDWIGRATDKEFIGFYSSQGHIGQFRLTRPSAATAAPK